MAKSSVFKAHLKVVKSYPLPLPNRVPYFPILHLLFQELPVRQIKPARLAFGRTLI